ncbi:MAG: succinate-semialdehyde dehydrogenase / glutarate-semialdehyde dehydrogenase, partial [Bacteroidota bacterium]|nr:succinate-semialdehyde dehydrogenase / glutarate-semialdehyde dehydrogenase [Bacteroidota bacterium]
MSIITINPATGEKLNEYPEHSYEECVRLIEKSHIIQNNWRKTSFRHRAELMFKASQILTDYKRKYGELMALEMGKPLAQGISEAEKCAWVCRYYAENAEEQLKDIEIKTEMKESFVSFQPLGTVLAIMPWNFPFWQVFRFAAPALMAGNAGLLKHSSNTMGCAIEIEKVFLKAGFPEGLFTTLVISSKPVVQLLEHTGIAAVTLTGSTPVGMSVAAKAGSLIKKTVLELGGSDPYIVLEDADLERTVQLCVTARFLNSGQSCIAAKRFIVVKPVLEKFEGLFVAKTKEMKMGNPLEDGINIGPQARKDLQLDLNRQVKDSIVKGAKLLLGGELPDTPGFFYPPT